MAEEIKSPDQSVMQGLDDFIQNLDTKTSTIKDIISQVQSSKGTIHVVVSILSGTGGAEDFYKNKVPKLLSKFDLAEERDYTTHFTKSIDTVTELTQDLFAPQALDGKHILIIILSGDGGIVDLVNGLAPHARKPGFVPPFVATLPFGTGNAVAHSSKIASDDTLGCRALCHGTPKTLPIFRVQFSPGSRLLVDEARRKEELPKSQEGRPTHPTQHSSGLRSEQLQVETPELCGAVVCSWGFHAAIVGDSDTAEYRKHGLERFKMAAEEALNPADGKGPHPYTGDVYFSHNGVWSKIPRGQHAYILAAAVSNLEQTFLISPHSKSMDGSLRLVHFGPLSGDDIYKIMMQAYAQGKHIENDAVGYVEIDGLWIDFKETGSASDDGERWRRVCVDGKMVAVEKDGWISLKKDPTAVLQLIVPT